MRTLQLLVGLFLLAGCQSEAAALQRMRSIARSSCAYLSRFSSKHKKSLAVGAVVGAAYGMYRLKKKFHMTFEEAKAEAQVKGRLKHFCLFWQSCLLSWLQLLRACFILQFPGAGNIWLTPAVQD